MLLLISNRKNKRKSFLKPCGTTDRVYAIRGCAGAGKTTCLTEDPQRTGGIRKEQPSTWRRPHLRSKCLRADGFARATTVDDFLTNQEKTGDLRGSVIIIDESSLQSSQMGAALLRIAQVYDTRVLFVGDVRQHVSVEAGDFLRILEQHSNLHRSELKDIRRQTG